MANRVDSHRRMEGTELHILRHQTQSELWIEVFITWHCSRCQTQENESSYIRRIPSRSLGSHLQLVEDHTTGCWVIADIANFKATQHAMWIQAHKDPDKKWLKIHYYIKEGDIDMVIKDWEDEWKIPVLTRDLSERTVEEVAVQEETQPQEVPVPKKRRTGQKKTKNTSEGIAKTGTQKGTKNNMQLAQAQHKQ
jgi:hypothetical protein